MKKLCLFIFSCFLIPYCYSQLEELNIKVTSTEDYFNIYQKTISDLRGNSCPMYPSCANYTLETIKERGLIQGILNGSDRLNRCGHEHKYYDLTLQEKGFKLLDQPVDKSNGSLIFRTKKTLFTSTMNYADSLLNEISLLINSGYISEAIILINRYKISNKIPNANIIEFEFICLNSKKEFEKVQYLYDLLDDSLKSNVNILKQFYVSCFNLGNYTSIINKERYINYSTTNDVYLSSHLKKYVFVSYLNQGMIHVADSFSKKTFDVVSDKKDATDAILQFQSLKQKSSILASTLSIIIPGAGYVYAGHTTTGISALVLNSLIGYASYSSFKSGNNGMGILTGIIGLGFYIGNIQGAAKSIVRENTYYKNKIIKNYIKQSIIN